MVVFEEPSSAPEFPDQFAPAHMDGFVHPAFDVEALQMHLASPIFFDIGESLLAVSDESGLRQLCTHEYHIFLLHARILAYQTYVISLLFRFKRVSAPVHSLKCMVHSTTSMPGSQIQNWYETIVKLEACQT
jgi:hypothetical protein